MINSLTNLLLSLLLYVALLVFIAGLARKIFIYSCTPQRFKMPTMPAPRTKVGVVARMFNEVVFFESLFKASIWTWVFAWLFHAGMVFTLIVHIRYLTDPTWQWVHVLIPFNKIASACMAVGLLGLLFRRCFVDRVRVISAPSDYLMLLFFLGIPLTGIAMRLFTNTDYDAVTRFARGIIQFSPQALVAHSVLLLHVGFVIVLLVIFPFSKLLHAPAVFFSPTRNQRDNARQDARQTKSGKPHG